MASFAQRILKGFEDFSGFLSDVAGGQPWHYNRLATADGESTLFADDGSMVSVLEVRGSMEMIGPEDFDLACRSLSQTLAARFASGGHVIQVVAKRDPADAHSSARSSIEYMGKTAHNLGLDLDGVITDWADSVSAFAAGEHVWLVAWTRPAVMIPAVRKAARKEMARRVRASNVPKGAQTIETRLMDLYNDHLGFIEAIRTTMLMAAGSAQGGILVDLMDCKSALRMIRSEIDGDMTSDGWEPLIPGVSRPPMRLADPWENAENAAPMSYPPLGEQLFPRDILELSQTAVLCGGRIHAPISMRMGPREPKSFQVLYNALVKTELPWRISFLIGSANQTVIGMRSTMASLLRYNGDNRLLLAAVEEMKAYQRDGGVPVFMSVVADTWVAGYKNLGEGVREAGKRATTIAAAFQSWGGAEMSPMTGGDPLLGLCASIPALLPTSPAQWMCAPIHDAISMLPLFRPASPWRAGIPMRSLDGKLLPYQPMSAQQTSWIDLGYAPMGFGKSVFLNTFDLAFILAPGIEEMPYLTKLDIGPSSKGLIDLLVAALPAEKRYLAVYRRLRMTPEYSINPLDTPLGCRLPLPSHITFLTNFVTLLCTPLDSDAPPDGVENLANSAVRAVFRNYADNGVPKRYHPDTDPEIAQAVHEHGMPIDTKTTWWEVVDFLFGCGEDHMAIRAQRYAVPTLMDLAAIVKSPEVSQLYQQSSTASGEPLIRYFERSIIEAAQRFPILLQPTTFDLGDARIVALDLDEVAPRNSPAADRQTGVMYMLARHVGASRFFVMPADVALMPEAYRKYHAARIQAIRELPKRLAMDEVHRITQTTSSSAVVDQVVADIVTAGREARKWNLAIGLYSQSASDFPKRLTELASSVFVLGGGMRRDILKQDVEQFGMNPMAESYIQNITKPDHRGSTMVVMHSTDRGRMHQPLKMSLGKQMVWAFSTTAEDTALRSRLYDRVGVRRALELLSARFGASAAKELASRRLAMQDRGELDDTENLFDVVADEIVRDFSAAQMAQIGKR